MLKPEKKIDPELDAAIEHLEHGIFKLEHGILVLEWMPPLLFAHASEGWMHEAVRLGFILAVALVMVMVLCSTLAHLGLPHFARCIKWVTDRLP